MGFVYLAHRANICAGMKESPDGGAVLNAEGNDFTIEFQKKSDTSDWEWQETAHASSAFHNQMITLSLPAFVTFQMPRDNSYYLQSSVSKDKIDQQMHVTKEGTFTIEVWKKWGPKRPRKKGTFK